MKKSTVVILAVFSVVVAGLVVAVLMFSHLNRTPDTVGADKTAAGATVDAKDNNARKTISPAMRQRMRPSRVYNGQRLPDMPMPTPQQRDALKAYGKAKEAKKNAAASTPPGMAGMDQNKNRIGQSVQSVIDRSRALKQQGKEEDAKKLLRNAIMIESNPYSRNILTQELTPTTKTVDTTVPAH